MGGSQSSEIRQNQQGSLRQEVVTLPNPPRQSVGSPHTHTQPEAPHLHVIQTSVKRCPVNLAKDSLSCAPAGGSLQFSFLFDANTDLEVLMFFFAREYFQDGIRSFLSDLRCPPPVRMGGGRQQRFYSSVEHSPTIQDFVNALGEKDRGGIGRTYDVVVQLRSVSSDTQRLQNEIYGQTTFAKLWAVNSDSSRDGSGAPGSAVSMETSGGLQRSPPTLQSYELPGACRTWHVEVTKQTVSTDVGELEVKDIFGIERCSSAASVDVGRSSSIDVKNGVRDEQLQQSHLLSGRECVICLEEDRTTAVLPCRHMCLCKNCADIMRVQRNKCPICRHPVYSFLQIRETEDAKAI